MQGKGDRRTNKRRPRPHLGGREVRLRKSPLLRIWDFVSRFQLRRRSAVLGSSGERLAARYLRRHGYRILMRNFRAAGAEIDLVALDGETLVFVEVKARRSEAAGSPLAAVDARKQARIRRAAEVYAARARAHKRPMRFDVVAIRARRLASHVELVKGAF